MATTVTIGGSSVSVPREIVLDKASLYTRHGIPSFTFLSRGGALPTADPYSGKEVVVTIDGTVRFTGDVVSVHPTFDNRLGWCRSYQCLGLRHRGDKIPHTDETTGIDGSGFNLSLEDPSYNSARAGRTVGQILTSVLTMTANAQALNSYGIGNYTGLPSAPALPSATTTDLAALDVIPPSPCTVQGEKLLGAIEGFLQEWAPNHALGIDPADGTLRFLDTRAFTPHTLTMGMDPIEPTALARDLANCSQRVVVRGQPIAVMYLFKLSQSTITEAFDHDTLDNTAAKAAWTAADFSGTSNFQDTGNCSCPNTTTVTLTSSTGGKTWTANTLDQSSTGRKATLNLYYTSGAGLTLMWTARVIANTATSGGATSCTIDAALPHLSFDKYTLTAQAGGASVVWRRYRIADTTLRTKVVSRSTYPQPFCMPGGGATVTSTPMGAVFYGGNMFPLPFTYESSTGYITFAAPTYTVAQNAAPSDVWVLLPVNTGALTVASPADVAGVPQYDGTSHSIEGLTDTLTVTVPAWRDPAQTTTMQLYADDLRDSVKDAAIEGTVTYHGLYSAALSMGISLNINANGFDVPYGWDTAALPVIECELEWSQGATHHVTRMRCSNRRAHYSYGQFMHPDRTGLTWGPPEGGTFGGEIAIHDPTSGINEAFFGNGQSSNSIPTTFADLGADPTGGYGTAMLQGTNNFGNDGSLENLLSKADSPTMIHPETSDESLARQAHQDEDLA